MANNRQIVVIDNSEAGRRKLKTIRPFPLLEEQTTLGIVRPADARATAGELLTSLMGRAAGLRSNRRAHGEPRSLDIAVVGSHGKARADQPRAIS